MFKRIFTNLTMAVEFLPYHSVEHLCIRYKLLDIPNISIEGHKLNKPNVDWFLTSQLHKITDLIIVETTHNNTIHLK